MAQKNFLFRNLLRLGKFFWGGDEKKKGWRRKHPERVGPGRAPHPKAGNHRPGKGGTPCPEGKGGMVVPKREGAQPALYRKLGRPPSEKMFNSENRKAHFW